MKNLLSIQFLTCIIIIWTTFHANIAIPRARGFNAKGNEFGDVAALQFLECFGNSCICMNPFDMVFDPEMNSCVAQLHKSCEIEVAWTRNNKNFKMIRNVPCGKNAVCDPISKRCRCDENILNIQQFFPITSERHFEKSCDSANETCPENSGLRCVDGFCQCGGGSSEFLSLKPEIRCLRRVDTPCNNSEECVMHSSCVTDDSVKGRCQCSPGYIPSSDRRCLSGYGSPCDVNQPCANKNLLHCVDGTCQCGSKFEIYNESKQRCEGLVGAVCKKRDSCIYFNDFCVEDASCGNSNSNEEDMVCKCRPTFEETLNHTCVQIPLFQYDPYNL